MSYWWRAAGECERYSQRRIRISAGFTARARSSSRLFNWRADTDGACSASARRAEEQVRDVHHDPVVGRSPDHSVPRLEQAGGKVRRD